MANAITSTCSAVGVIRGQIIGQLMGLHQRFESARRAVQLARGMLNNVALPLIPNLPALATLNFNEYNRLRIACPALGLPALDTGVLGQLPGIRQLEQLRQAYQSAVRGMLDRLERSPMGLIDQLESELNKKIDSVLKAVTPYLGVLNCVCDGIDAISNPANIEVAKNFYSNVTAKPTLLDDELSGRMSTFREMKGSLAKIVS